MIHENQDQKFLIFCHHKIMIESICDLLNDEKIYHIKIDGNIKSDVRTVCPNYSFICILFFLFL